MLVFITKHKNVIKSQVNLLIAKYGHGQVAIKDGTDLSCREISFQFLLRRSDKRNKYVIH